MNQIDNIMRQIGEYTARHPDGDAQALRAAIEAALTPGEPVGEVAGYYERGFDEQKTLYGKLYNQDLPLGIKLFTAPQPQREWVEEACARIKAADDAAADCDYMLDSNDCIAVLRGEWKHPLANDFPQPKQESVATLFGSLPVYDTAPQPQPKQEPVACPSCGSTQVECAVCAAGFTAPQPQQWVGLTDEEWQFIADTLDCMIRRPQKNAIEAMLREKNGGGRNDTTLLRQALEALEDFDYDKRIAAIAALRERLK